MEVGERLATPTPTWDQEGLTLPLGARVLHIGPHKTGTTAVQASLNAARAELDRQGVYYASDYRHAMTAVLAGLQLPNAWGDDKEPPPRWKWERLLGKVRSTLDALSRVPESRGGPTGPVSVSPEIAASAAMGVLIGAGLARGSGPITAEVESMEEGGRTLKAPPMVQEPAELLRLSSSQLQIVLIRRARAALAEKLGPLLFWRRR